jgi:hypothetical protein
MGGWQDREADETFIGKNELAPKGRCKPGIAFRNIVLTLVERDGFAAASLSTPIRLPKIAAIVRANVHRETAINTDEGKSYNEMGEHFASHDTVNHSKDEYVRYPNIVDFPDGKPRPIITTNTVEGFYSVFKRGMGVYQHCSEKHLHRYLSEFDFRYSNPRRIGRQRRGTCGPCHQGRGWQASDVSSTSLSGNSGSWRGVSCAGERSIIPKRSPNHDSSNTGGRARVACLWQGANVMTKPVTLQHLTAFGDDPTKRVTLFLGDGPDAAQSSQWISAQLAIEMQPHKSFSLLRLTALRSMRDLIGGEIQRLTNLYDQAESTHG